MYRYLMSRSMRPPGSLATACWAITNSSGATASARPRKLWNGWIERSRPATASMRSLFSWRGIPASSWPRSPSSLRSRLINRRPAAGSRAKVQEAVPKQSGRMPFVAAGANPPVKMAAEMQLILFATPLASCLHHPRRASNAAMSGPALRLSSKRVRRLHLAAARPKGVPASIRQMKSDDGKETGAAYHPLDNRSDDLQLKSLQSVDMAEHHVALLHGADTCRRSGHDQIARLQFEQLGEKRNHLGHLPDHLGKVALLAHLPIDLQPDRTLIKMSAFGYRNKRSTGPGLLKGLSDIPGAAELLCLALKITPRHVEADAITPDAFQRLLDRNIAPTLIERHDHLDFEMNVLGFRRIRKLGARINVACALLKEERWLLVRIM